MKEDQTESYRKNAGEVGAGLAAQGPLVINRTKKEIGSGADEMFHPGDCGYLTKEDVAALHFHARQHGHNDDKLQYRVHSPLVLGANVLCWEGNSITPHLVQRIMKKQGWPDGHLVGVALMYDEDLPVDEFHLEQVLDTEGLEVVKLGMVKTTFQLYDGPE